MLWYFYYVDAFFYRPFWTNDCEKKLCLINYLVRVSRNFGRRDEDISESIWEKAQTEDKLLAYWVVLPNTKLSNRDLA